MKAGTFAANALNSWIFILGAAAILIEHSGAIRVKAPHDRLATNNINLI